VLRLRPSLPGDADDHGHLDDEVLLTEAPKGSIEGADAGASIAILRRPRSTSSAGPAPSSNSSSNSGSSKKTKSKYGISMLRPTASGSSPMGRLASLRHGGQASRTGAAGADAEADEDKSAAEGIGTDDIGISYQFDSILNEKTTQAATYDSVGVVAALDATEPLMKSSTRNRNNNDHQTKDHVIFTLGTSNSGKTHTAIGSGGEGSAGYGQGLAPRLIDDLFRQYDRRPSLFDTSSTGTTRGAENMSTSSGSNKRDDGLAYALRLTMVHVHGSKVYDMLSTSIASGDGPTDGAGGRTGTTTTSSSRPSISKRMSHASGASSVKKMVASMENYAGGSSTNSELSRPDGDIEEVRLVKSSKTGLFRADANVETCREFLEAQETLYDGLDEVVVDGSDNTIKRSRGHTIVTVQPVLVNAKDEIEKEGGKVTIIDLAVNEPQGSGSSRKGGEISTSSAKNETVAAVLECLNSIKKYSGRNGSINNANPTGSSSGKKKKKKKDTSSDEISYRENKLTMLMQPLFSNGKGVEERTTAVTLLVAASQEGKDYSEKKTLLAAVESLRLVAGDSVEDDSYIKPTVGLELTPTKAPVAPASTPRASNIASGRLYESPGGAANRSETFSPPKSKDKTGKKKEHHTSAAAAAVGARSPLPPTHPRSEKKRDNPFALSERTNSDRALDTSPNKSRSPVRSSKKKIKSKTNEEEVKRTPPKSFASKSWLDISQDVPPAGTTAAHSSANTGSTASESYSKKIMGFVDKSPLRKVGHAVSGVSSSITGTAVGGTKRHRMAASRDEDDDQVSSDQQRKAARKLEQDNIRLQDRVMYLEEDREALRQKNASLEQNCEELTRENGNLVQLLEETKRNAYRSGLQQYAEKEAEKEEAERDARMRDQALLKSPLMAHMKHVMQTSNEQMAWQLQDKPHYSLTVPHKEAWTCGDLYKHQTSSNVITEMGNALAKSIHQEASGNECGDMDEDEPNSLASGTF